MLYSDQDTFEESVSDSSTEVIEMFYSSTEENSFVKSEVDDNEVEEDNQMEDDSDDIFLNVLFKFHQTFTIDLVTINNFLSVCYLSLCSNWAVGLVTC